MAGANVTSPTGSGQVTQERCLCAGIHRHESDGFRGGPNHRHLGAAHTVRAFFRGHGSRVERLARRLAALAWAPASLPPLQRRQRPVGATDADRWALPMRTLQAGPSLVCRSWKEKR